MQRNRVQFQKGLSLGTFLQRYGSEPQCAEAKHVPRYLAAFSYRFNRRYQLADLVLRLVYASANTPPMPCRLLKLDESCV